MRRIVGFAAVLGVALQLVSVSAGGAPPAPAPASPPASPEANFYPIPTLPYAGGVQMIKRAGWFGINTWLSNSNIDDTRGYFLAMNPSLIGSDRDFYTRAGLNVGFFTPLVTGPWDSDPKLGPERDFVRDSLARMEKAGLKVSINFDQAPPFRLVQRAGWYWIDDHGRTIKFPRGQMYHDPEENARVYGDFIRPIIEMVRDDPNVIDYQISGESFPFDTLTARTDVSYDAATIARFRDYLRARYTLEDLGRRYGNSPGLYATWDDVFPPAGPESIFDNGKTGSGIDCAKRPLPNYPVARWDWYRCKKQIIADIWVAMIKKIQELDGHGRTVNYEFNHGPYMDTRIYPLAEVATRAPGFHVGHGEFEDDIAGALKDLSYQKTTAPGPWVNNELDGGSGATGTGSWVDAAYIRRHIWGNLALGVGGYQFWTFSNILGAKTEFDTHVFDPGNELNLPLKYFEVKHTNRMIDALGPLLGTSRAPALDIGLLYLDESTYNWTYIGSYGNDGSDIIRSVSARGLGDKFGIYTEYNLDHQDLNSLKAIILPRTPRITEAHMARLASWVKAGGTLILMGPTGRFGEMCREFPSFPGGPLAPVAGVEAHVMPSGEVRASPITVEVAGRPVNIDVQTRLSISPGSSAEVVAAAGGRPLVTRHRFGRGLCYYMAGEPLLIDGQDPTADFLAGILRAAGSAPAARAEEARAPADGVFLSRRVTPDGVLLFLIDEADRTHRLTVTLDPAQFGLTSGRTYRAFECFSDERHDVSAAGGWRFQTDLEPVGVRCFLVTSRDSLDAVIPLARRLRVPRAPDAVLLANGPKADVGTDARPYLVQDAIVEHLRILRDAAVQPTGAPGPLRDLGAGYAGVDLAPFASAPLRDLILGVDYTPQNFGAPLIGRADASSRLPIAAGVTRLGDVPALSPGRFVSVLRKAEGLRVGSKAGSISFFDGGNYSEHTSVVGFCRVNYADGSSLRVPIAHWSTLGDFGRRAWFQDKCVLIWSGKTRSGDERFLYRYDWVNPFPGKLIRTIDVVNINRVDSRPISIWAITVHH